MVWAWPFSIDNNFRCREGDKKQLYYKLWPNTLARKACIKMVGLCPLLVKTTPMFGFTS